MGDLKSRMRDVLLQLALTSNGRTISYDASGGGTPDWTLIDDRGRAKLSIDDAPQLLFAELWDAAEDDEQRAAVLKDAADHLRKIKRSSGDPSKEESRDDRDRRIVAEGDGMPARDVAVWARCGVRDVQKARQAAGRDVELGRPVRRGADLSPAERDAEIARLTKERMNARQIAHALGLSYSTILRSLGRKDAAERVDETSGKRPPPTADAI